MAAMGRRRKSNLGLEPRVYHHHGAFYYVHRSGRWEHLGTDKDVANGKAKVYNDATGEYGTLVYWLSEFLLDCARRVALKSAVKGVKLSPRTLEDYQAAIGTPDKPGPLRDYFPPPFAPLDLTPDVVQQYLRDGAELGRAVRANRERACLSSCISWLIREKKVPGLIVNPCLRGSGIQRNPEAKRERYVTDDEYRDVWAMATPAERLLMELTYRTLQRPESDIILWDRRKVIKVQDGRRVLDFRQHKTGRRMLIGFSPELEQLLPVETVVPLRADAPDPVVRRRDGGFYTYDGLSSMLKESIKAANVRRKARKVPPIASFGYRDLKGKGATDMWLAGEPIEKIQALLGHANKTTTEIYVKQRWVEAVEPNSIQIG